METIFTNMENSKTIEPHKFVLSLSQRLALQNLSFYYTWKKIRKEKVQKH